MQIILVFLSFFFFCFNLPIKISNAAGKCTGGTWEGYNTKSVCDPGCHDVCDPSYTAASEVCSDYKSESSCPTSFG